MKITKKYILGIIAVLLSIIFLYVMDRVVDNEISKFDTMIYEMFIHSNWRTIFMKCITFMGEPVTFVVISIIVFFFVKSKKLAFTVPLNLGLIGSINYLIKCLVKRPRPIGINLIEIGGYSFPSGHSATSLAFYGFLMYLIYKKCKNQKLKVISMISLSLLIFFIGLSRIYLGVHFASDVVGGFALSSIYLIIYIIMMEQYIEGGSNEINKKF